MNRLSNGASNALWTTVCFVLLGALSACDDTSRYCYKGHDEIVVSNNDGSKWVQFVCDEWRNTAGKYPGGASDAAAR